MRTGDDGSAEGYWGSLPHPDGTDSTDTHGKAFTGVNTHTNTKEADKLPHIIKKHIPK